MKSGIYKLYFKSTDKVYIGSSSDIKSRINSHRSNLRRNTHSNKKLQNYYNKYNEEFQYEILATCDKEYNIKLEQWFLNNFIVWGYDFNINKEAKGSAPNKDIILELKLGEFVVYNSAKDAALSKSISYDLMRDHIVSGRAFNNSKFLRLRPLGTPLKLPKRKIIGQYNLEGDLVGTYNSYRRAKLFSGTFRDGIKRSILQKVPCANSFIWVYNKEGYFKNKIDKYVIKESVKIEKLGITKYFTTATECAIYLGVNVSSVTRAYTNEGRKCKNWKVSKL